MKKKQLIIVTYTNSHLQQPVTMYFDNNKPGLAKAISASLALIEKHAATLPAYQDQSSHKLDKASARYKKLVKDLKKGFQEHMEYLNKRMGVTFKTIIASQPVL
jgi:predicted negative regulator of RcsB-dependent stress response